MPIPAHQSQRTWPRTGQRAGTRVAPAARWVATGGRGVPRAPASWGQRAPRPLVGRVAPKVLSRLFWGYGRCAGRRFESLGAPLPFRVALVAAQRDFESAGRRSPWPASALCFLSLSPYFRLRIGTAKGLSRTVRELTTLSYAAPKGEAKGERDKKTCRGQPLNGQGLIEPSLKSLSQPGQRITGSSSPRDP